MPLLIKNSNGLRTARVLNQKTEIIEALKGLTFNIELQVKLADIIAGDATSGSTIKITTATSLNGAENHSTRNSSMTSSATSAAASDVTNRAAVSEMLRTSSAASLDINQYESQTFAPDGSPIVTRKDEPEAPTNSVPSSVKPSFPPNDTQSPFLTFSNSTVQNNNRIRTVRPASPVQRPKSPATVKRGSSPTQTSRPSPPPQSSRPSPSPQSSRPSPPPQLAEPTKSLQLPKPSDYPKFVESFKEQLSNPSPASVPAAPASSALNSSPASIDNRDKIQPKPREPAPEVKNPSTRPECSLKVGTEIEACCIAYESTDVDATIAYISRDSKSLVLVTDLIKKRLEDIESFPHPNNVTSGQEIFAQSNDDDQWYRATVESFSGDQVDVFFFDWGLKETLSIKRIRPLNLIELTSFKIPPSAIKICVKNSYQKIVEEFIQCEEVFKVMVKEFDEKLGLYNVSLIGKV